MAAMRRIALMGVLTLTLGIGAEALGQQTSSPQQATDSRVADLVRAGKLRVGLGLGVPTLAIKDPATVRCAGRRWILGGHSPLGSGLTSSPSSTRDQVQ